MAAPLSRRMLWKDQLPKFLSRKASNKESVEHELEVVDQGKDQSVLSSGLSGFVHEGELEVSVSLRKIGSEKVVANKHPQLSSAIVADASGSAFDADSQRHPGSGIQKCCFFSTHTRDLSAKMALRGEERSREQGDEGRYRYRTPKR